MKLKKLVALSTVTILSASMLVGCGDKSSQGNASESIKVGMVADTGGINDLTKVHGKDFNKRRKI